MKSNELEPYKKQFKNSTFCVGEIFFDWVKTLNESSRINDEDGLYAFVAIYEYYRERFLERSWDNPFIYADTNPTMEILGEMLKGLYGELFSTDLGIAKTLKIIQLYPDEFPSCTKPLVQFDPQRVIDTYRNTIGRISEIYMKPSILRMVRSSEHDRFDTSVIEINLLLAQIATTNHKLNRYFAKGPDREKLEDYKDQVMSLFDALLYYIPSKDLSSLLIIKTNLDDSNKYIEESAKALHELQNNTIQKPSKTKKRKKQRFETCLRELGIYRIMRALVADLRGDLKTLGNALPEIENMAFDATSNNKLSEVSNCRVWIYEGFDSVSSHRRLRPNQNQLPIHESVYCFMDNMFSHPYSNESDSILALHKTREIDNISYARRHYIEFALLRPYEARYPSLQSKPVKDPSPEDMVAISNCANHAGNCRDLCDHLNPLCPERYRENCPLFPGQPKVVINIPQKNEVLGRDVSKLWDSRNR